MTPKEKAKELYDMHKTLFKHYDANPRLNIGLHEYFKQCAIITVDEILNELDLQNHLLRSYWYDVKQEIELL